MVYNPTWPQALPPTTPATSHNGLLSAPNTPTSCGSGTFWTSSFLWRKKKALPHSLHSGSAQISSLPPSPLPLALMEDFISSCAEKGTGLTSVGTYTVDSIVISTSRSLISHPVMFLHLLRTEALNAFAYNRCTEREKKRYLDFLSWRQQIFLFLGYNCIIIMYLRRAFHLRISGFPSTK